MTRGLTLVNLFCCQIKMQMKSDWLKVSINLVAFPPEKQLWNKVEQRYEIGLYTTQKMKFFINSFVLNTPILYPMKTSENLAVFWCFQEVEKGSIGNKWAKISSVKILYNKKNHFLYSDSTTIKTFSKWWIFIIWRIESQIYCNYCNRKETNIYFETELCPRT